MHTFPVVHFPIETTSILIKSESRSYFTTPNSGNSTGYEMMPNKDDFDSYKVIFNISSAIMGAGILGLPRSLADCGWYGGIIILVTVSCQQTYTGRLIGDLMIAMPQARYYSDVGYMCFGATGRNIVICTQMAQCLGVSILYLILAGSNLNSIFSQNEDNRFLYTSLVAFILLPTIFFRSIKEIAIISVLGVITSILVSFIIVKESLFHPMEHPRYTSPTMTSMSSAAGTMIFAYGAHALFPSIQHDMANKKVFNRCLYQSFALIFVVYIAVSISSFYAFGCHLQSNVLHNLASASNLTLFVSLLITGHVIAAYALFMSPVFTTIESMWGLGHRLNSNSEYYKSCVLRAAMIGLTFLVAVSIPFFGDVMSLLGCSCITMLSVLLPVAFFTRFFWESLSSSTIFLHALICIVSLTVGLLGTMEAANTIYKNSSEYSLFSSRSVQQHHIMNHANVQMVGHLCV